MSTSIELPVSAAVRRMMKRTPDALAESFRKQYAKAEKLLRQGLGEYITAGEYLLALRKRAPHGVWATTLEGLGLSPSTGDRLLLFGQYSDLARAALEQHPEMTVKALEGAVRTARAIPLEEQPDDLPALVAASIDKSQQQAKTRKTARAGEEMRRTVLKGLDALEAHVSVDPSSPEALDTLAIVKRRITMLEGLLHAEDATPHQ